MTTANLDRIIQRLVRVENLAFECYQKAQEIQGLSAGFVDFLQRCAEEEAWHLNALKKAASHLAGNEEIVSALKVDSSTSERVEAELNISLQLFGKKGIGEREVLERVISFEFSEWNPIFIYVLDLLTEITGESLYPAAQIRLHLQRIIDYAELTGFEHEKLRRLRTLPRIWEESILAVDDEDSIRELLAGILQTCGRVDLARDGFEALEMLRRHYYKVIITDIHMPNLDGMGFFREALEIYPNIAERFIFLSGDPVLPDSGEPGIGAATILGKPFRATELVEMVKARLKNAAP
jgi:CheY-like chemotaxis protein